VGLYGRYRQALADGDFETFLDSIYPSSRQDGTPVLQEGGKPKDFALVKDFMFKRSPDLTGATILKFAHNNGVAILVAQTGLENTDAITLTAIRFATADDQWKVLPKLIVDTFPSKDPEADAVAVERALKEDPRFQLTDAVVQVQAIKTPSPEPPAPVAAPSDEDLAEADAPVGPSLSPAFNDSPEHEAIVKLLLIEEETEILQTATSIGMSKLEDFAAAVIGYTRQGDSARTQLFLFKDDNAWTAYRELPTHRDHPAVFTTLAEQYCRPRFPRLQGIGFIDDSHKNTNPTRRTIHLACSELIDNQWVDHRLRLVYAYDADTGWHIVSGTPLDETAPPPPSEAAETATFSDEVTDRFFLSILEGDMAAVQGFLDAGMSPNVKRPRLGHSPLYTAVMSRNDEMAMLFLSLGADVNFTDAVGATPLLRAAGNCQSLKLVKALVAAGADVNAKAKGGGTPLMIAEAMRCSDIAETLRAAGAE
jgi:hypothetical protein